MLAKDLAVQFQKHGGAVGVRQHVDSPLQHRHLEPLYVDLHVRRVNGVALGQRVDAHRLDRGKVGIGPIVAGQIATQLADDQMKALIADLKSVGLNFEQEGPSAVEGPLNGLTFVLTGALPNLTREEAQEKIVAAGGRVTSSVPGKTSYVVAGESPGSKLQRAERLGVSVIDEAKLLELCQSSSPP